MAISYAITVCDEEQEFIRLIDHLINYIHSDDEIVVLCDISKKKWDIEKQVINKNNVKCQIYKDNFDKNFADWKNKLNSLCTKDYIFQIDADELPNPYLLVNLQRLLYTNPTIELIWVPRENYVDGITSEHIKLWGWNLDSKNRINFPDYQGRIYKNSKNIAWSGKVHETIQGAKNIAALPQETQFSILHKKNISKQEQQNNLYSTL